MTLPKKNRLTKKKEIDQLFKEKKTVRGVFLFIRYKENDSILSRFAFIIPNKIYSKATDRNRIRRILSGIAGNNLSNIRSGIDYAVVVSRKAEDAEFKKETESLFDKLRSNI